MIIEPYGGILVDLLEADVSSIALKARADVLPSIQLSERAVCDLEMLTVGAFSPLDRFMGAADTERVLTEMRLSDGRLFPIPVTLTVSPSPCLGIDREIALRGPSNDLLAVMRIEEVLEWNRRDFAERAFGTSNSRHPVVAEMEQWGTLQISGPLRVLQTPRHYDFRSLRLTPRATRAALGQMGKPNVVAFQTRNPMHRAHEELTKRAAIAVNGVLLLQPVVGMTKPGDVDHYTRVRTYLALVSKYYQPGSVLLTLLPLAMRMAGPREGLWHALIRRNYGANYLIVGRDHASPETPAQERAFYGAYDAQELLERYSGELGVTMLPFGELVYVPDEGRYEDSRALKAGTRTISLSGTQARTDFLMRGKALPDWFTRPEIADILADAYPPSHRQGCAIWLTGLSGAGKTTTAQHLVSLLLECGRQTTLLDGDIVRTHLSKGLGFSRNDRDANILRIGFVASEIVRHGGIVICAAISPYRSTRDSVRAMFRPEHFVEVFVDAPIAVCEQRDPKGFYAQARRGELQDFTGIDAPYEAPYDPEIVLDTVAEGPFENAQRILIELESRGLLRLGHHEPPASVSYEQPSAMRQPIDAPDLSQS
jgi:sulfate adenylyltransferase